LRSDVRGDVDALATTGLAEALVQSLLSCIVQVYALVHETWTSAQKKTLQVSIVISVLSLAKFFSEFDKEEKVLWNKQFQFDLVKGRTPQASLHYAGVFAFRLLSVTSRLFFFPLFQEATHEVLKIRGVAFGGPLVWLVDFGIQLALVWHATRDPAKLPLAVANTVSPAEPLLQDVGGPVYSAWPLLVVTVHFLEWCTATAVILGVNSRDVRGSCSLCSALLVRVEEHLPQLAHNGEQGNERAVGTRWSKHDT